ncbi:hypothetical protein HK096_005948 [Nowakowskiella sp. JEL0078]|nr:hypothetical protein HK096_005948 [Nowakowskiella sp. JEL0078]
MAQASLNIPRDVKDIFYRYKMPKIIAKIEGRGNGIKTVIPNMTDVAKALDRPATYTTKYFGTDLGALSSCDDKKDRYLVNGAFDAERLQTSLDGFITRFVLCGSCRNPETDLSITKDERIFRVCKACGARTPVDLTHRLCTYVIKNPPKKKSKGKANGTAENSDKPPSPSRDSKDEDDEITRQIYADVAKLGDREVDDDDFGEDTSALAVAERMSKLAAKLKVGDDEDDLEDPVEGFADFLTASPNASDAEIIAESISLGIKKYKAIVILVQVLFNEDILNQIPKRTPLLKMFVDENDENYERAQKGLIGGIERLVGLSFKAQLMKKVPLIFKMFYDEDLLEEEVILKWGEKISKRYVSKVISQEIHESALQFLNWLKTADQEEEEDEE